MLAKKTVLQLELDVHLGPVDKFCSEINVLSAISACDNITNGEQPLLEELRKAGTATHPNAQDQSSSNAEQEINPDTTFNF